MNERAGRKVVYWSSVAALGLAVLLSMLCSGAVIFGLVGLVGRLLP